MDRRESLKAMLIASLGGTMLIKSCAPGTESEITSTSLKESTGYGRTSDEKLHDAKLNSEVFFSDHEIATIAILCDIILPSSGTSGSATDAGVPEFIEFIVKDLPGHQLPIRGGLMWLDSYANKLYNSNFLSCNEEQKLSIIDKIAYPGKTAPGLEQGETFFTRMRNLSLTGYYTTKMGIEDLGYKGNTPNVWDGVPQEVLKKHGLSYEEEWLAKCIDQTKRMDIAQWDDDGNLIT